MRGNGPKKQGNIRRAKKQGGPRPTPHKKTCGFACAFLAEIQPKKTPHTPVWGVFLADFISKIHWQNCFAPKKSKFCAELRRDGAGMLTHGKTAQRRSPCKICLLRRMFSYVEPAKTVLFHSIKRCISCGIGAVKCNFCPVTGWVNHSSYECSAGRAMRVLSSMP